MAIQHMIEDLIVDTLSFERFRSLELHHQSKIKEKTSPLVITPLYRRKCPRVARGGTLSQKINIKKKSSIKQASFSFTFLIDRFVLSIVFNE